MSVSSTKQWLHLNSVYMACHWSRELISLCMLQALLSSSIMFSNFMSIYQRRAEAKEKAEQSNRYTVFSYALSSKLYIAA